MTRRSHTTLVVTTSTVSRARLPVFLAVTALVATSCLRTEITIRVDDDGSGTIDGISAVDTRYFTTDQPGVSVEGSDDVSAEPLPTRDEVCARFRADQEMPPGLDAELYDEGDHCGFAYHAEFAEGGVQRLLPGAEDLILERDGDGWRFAAPLDQPSDDDLLPIEALEEMELVVRVRLPGRQIEHNADRIEADGTLVWDVDTARPPALLFARTVPGEPITGSTGGGVPALAWFGAALVMVVGALLLRMRRRSASRHEGQSSPTPTGRVGSAPHSDHDPT